MSNQSLRKDSYTLKRNHKQDSTSASVQFTSIPLLSRFTNSTVQKHKIDNQCAEYWNSFSTATKDEPSQEPIAAGIGNRTNQRSTSNKRSTTSELAKRIWNPPSASIQAMRRMHASSYTAAYERSTVYHPKYIIPTPATAPPVPVTARGARTSEAKKSEVNALKTAPSGCSG